MTDTENSIASKPKGKKGLSPSLVLFILSFALNLFFIGLLVGVTPRLISGHDRTAWHGERGIGEHRYMGRHMGSMGQVMHGLYSLPDEMKEKMRDHMKSSRAEIRPIFRELHDNSRQTIEILSASPLDISALRQNFDKQNELRGQAERLGQTSFINFVESLNEEEKAELSKALQKSKDKPWKGHGKRHWRDDHPSSSDDETGPLPPE